MDDTQTWRRIAELVAERDRLERERDAALEQLARLTDAVVRSVQEER